LVYVYNTEHLYGRFSDDLIFVCWFITKFNVGVVLVVYAV